MTKLDPPKYIVKRLNDRWAIMFRGFMIGIYPSPAIAVTYAIELAYKHSQRNGVRAQVLVHDETLGTNIVWASGVHPNPESPKKKAQDIV